MFVCLDLCGGIEVWIKQTTASLLLNATLPFLSGGNISKGQVERFFSRPALKKFLGPAGQEYRQRLNEDHLLLGWYSYITGLANRGWTKIQTYPFLLAD
jgi:hypothetical protein